MSCAASASSCSTVVGYTKPSLFRTQALGSLGQTSPSRSSSVFSSSSTGLLLASGIPCSELFLRPATAAELSINPLRFVTVNVHQQLSFRPFRLTPPAQPLSISPPPPWDHLTRAQDSTKENRQTETPTNLHRNPCI
jgi:hypothetical protein